MGRAEHVFVGKDVEKFVLRREKTEERKRRERDFRGSSGLP